MLCHLFPLRFIGYFIVDSMQDVFFLDFRLQVQYVPCTRGKYFIYNLVHAIVFMAIVLPFVVCIIIPRRS